MADEMEKAIEKDQETADSEGQLAEKDLAQVAGGSFEIEQVLNIGSQSSGAGAGKVTFNP